jgi:hypothetical protein
MNDIINEVVVAVGAEEIVQNSRKARHMGILGVYDILKCRGKSS